MKDKQLVLQFRVTDHGSLADFDRLVDIEDELDDAIQLDAVGYVDGHDMGSGEMNLFIIVKDWDTGTAFLEKYIRQQSWANDAVLAKENEDDTYVVIWPKDFKGEFAVT
jgi:hypothetical protein